MRALFIHRSVGHNLIADGGLYTLLKPNSEIDLSDYDQNFDLLTHANGKRDKPGLAFPANDTKPASYAAIFSDNVRNAFLPIRDLALSYDTIIIKSCYPNNDIRNAKQLEEIKGHYRSVAAFFNKQKTKKLIILTSPPLAPLMTNPNRAKRARELATWLETVNLGENVTVFNFYDKLADPQWH